MITQARIQWEGTDVCMDVDCSYCGESFHIDGDFAYFVRCPTCETAYRTGCEITLSEIDPDVDDGEVPAYSDDLTLDGEA